MKLQITTVKTAIFALLILSIIRSFPDGYAAIEERAARQLDFYVQSGEIVDQIAWSPSGANIAVVMDQGGTPIDHVVVYDSTTLEELGTIEAPNIWDLAWNSSGSQLATIQSTGRTIIKTWDVSVTPFSLVMEYEDDDPAGVTDLAWRPNSEELTFNRVLAARSIDAQTGVLIRSFTLDEDYTPGPLAWSPDGSKLLVDTARALMWDVNGDLLLDLWSGFFFSPFAWSPDSQQFVVEQGESIQILDAETGALIRTLEGGFGIRTEISWGDTVIAAGRDSVEDFGIYLWDANTGEIMERIDPGAPPNAVALSPDGTQLAYAGVDGTFQVAPVPSGTPNCDPPFTIANDDTAALISAITTANGTPEPDTICLADGGTYTFTAAYSSSNALPKITSEITIEGNNATLTRDAAAPEFRLIQVESTGTLTLNDLTLTNGNDNGSGSIPYVVDFSGASQNLRRQSPKPRPFYCSAHNDLSTIGDSNAQGLPENYFGFGHEWFFFTMPNNISIPTERIFVSIP